MNWLSIDFKQTFVDLSPTFFRDVRFDFFNSAFAAPLQSLADKTLYEMQHDSRVIYLEKVLNEYFEIETYNPNSHIATRQIYIIDTPKAPKTYIFQTEENQPVYLGTVYLDREQEFNADFIIKVPEAIAFDEPKLRAMVNFYKLAGKKYLIQTY